MDESKQQNAEQPDRDIARLLAAAGSREALPEETKARWEAHFRAELNAARREGRSRAWLPLAALAASVVLLVLVLDFFAADPSGSTPIQVQAVSGEAQLVLEESRVLAAVAGQNLAAGVSVHSGRNGRVALSWAGFDVRLNQNSRLALMNDRVRLDAGEIYISSVGRRLSRQRIQVVTPYATISDIGTQFMVRLEPDGVTASVREGSILVSTADGEHRAEATHDSGRSLTVGADREVQVSDDRSDWAWIYAVSPTFKLEGRSVHDFLRWATTESGQRLRYADDDAALAARNTRFSGTVDLTGFDPVRAVEVILPTTRFVATPEGDGSLRVARRSE